jgi:hypothetical protein
LVTLTDCAELLPNFTLAKARLVFVKDRPAMPLPENVDCCGLVAALSKIVSVALCEPTAFGVNATPSVQFVLGATVIGTAPQVPLPLRAYSAGSDEMAFGMISGLVAPVFLTVRFFVTVWPTGTLPNASDAVTDIEVVGVEVGVADPVGVDVKVPVALVVAVGVSVTVAVWVAVAVPVGVTVAVTVAVGVAVEVAVAVAVPVRVAVAVGVAVAVAVNVAAGVGVRVTVAVAVAVGVALGVAVAVAVGPEQAALKATIPPAWSAVSTLL